jgi:Outer membrane protein beta-barrel domain
MRRPSPSALFGIFVFAVCLAVSSAARAQDQFTRIEVGGQFDGIRLLNTGDRPEFTPGFGARLDINLTRRIAFESTLDFFPRQAPEIFGQGGQTLQFTAGMRAKFVTTRRYSIYGVVRPGLTHETNNFLGEIVAFQPPLPINNNPSGPLNHLSLDLGGGVEIYPNARWILRGEVAASPYFVRDEPLTFITPPSGAFIFVQPPRGEIFATWKLSVGASYRIGALKEYARTDNASNSVDAQNRLDRLTIGVQASSLSLKFTNELDGHAATEAGFGPFASYRIWRFVEADASMSFFPREAQPDSFGDGGRILQGLFGVRAGFRTKHMGFFAKARPGFQSYSQNLSSITSPPDFSSESLAFTRATDFALDLGGVIEIYPTKHFVIRIDAGDTSIFPGARNFITNGVSFSEPAQPRKDTIQFGAGFGWRF